MSVYLSMFVFVSRFCVFLSIFYVAAFPGANFPYRPTTFAVNKKKLLTFTNTADNVAHYI